MKRKPYRYLLYLGLRGMQSVVAWLPRSAALRLAGGVARMAFWVARREREKTLVHLGYAYGSEKSPEELKALGQEVFCHFARVAVDVLRFPKLTGEELDRLVEGKEQLSVINGVLSEGRGMILLTGHLGNWEWMGAFLRARGYSGAVVARRLYYDRFDQMMLDLRGEFTLKTIYQDASPKEFLSVLHRNEILGILADQDIDRLDGIFVPFFGRPAYTLTAPVKLALATGAPIVPVFLLRDGERYRLVVEEPIRVEMKGTREETIREYTVRWAQVMEEKIRAYPAQWAWMHRRWKTQAREAASYETVRCS